ncbi:putative ribonuclease H-like domain-containing protein [Tanacetum coccineum]|uniref:Ribonuclease H-like domain-containing protein n=1 Tax=Tanacetum coccineum TaxID=301880 RepID=A0ABQ4ZSA7_9ASTR
MYNSPSQTRTRAFNQKSAAKTNNLNEKVKTAKVNNVTTAGPKAVVSAAKGNGENVVKSSACWIWRPTGNDIDGGFVAFGGSPKEGKITRKGKIRTGKLDFEDVYFVKELKFNLFSVSQMCDKKSSVLFTENECLVLSPDFNLLDESQVLLKVPRQNNMYSFDLKNVVPSGGLTCLFAKATIDESNLWHRRLGHINFKTINKLVRGNLVRGLPSKIFVMTILVLLVRRERNTKPLVKVIRCDNGTEFKNNDMNQFCGIKGIKREFSVARTPQQNGVAERKNRTLIEAARTMLADSLLPTTFWAEAVSTACYVQNRVLVTKPHNKTPYELLHGRPPSISFMRPFGCPVTILNTLDPLGKFDGKADEGFFVGYSINSKAFRVFNTRTRKVEENLHITFLENKPNVAGSGPDWLFDIDLLTNSMNYEPVTAGNQTNKNAGIKDNVDAVPTQQYILLPLLYDSPQSSKDAVADDAGKKTNEEPANEGERNGQEKEGGASNKEDDQNVQDFRAALDNLLVQQKEGYANSTNRDSTVSPSVSTAGQSFTNVDDLPTDPLMPDLEDTADLLNTGIFSGAYDDEDVGAEADLNNLETTMNVSPIPTTRIHKDHPKDQIIGDINSATQTRRMTKISEELAMVSYIKKQRRTNHKDYQNCLFTCFLSQIEPKKVTQALTDPSWIEAMQDELLQFSLRDWLIYQKASMPLEQNGIEAIRLFLAYASFMGFIVYQMDVKSAFLYGTIEEEVYVYQPPGFEDPQFPGKVYKVEKALYSLHQALRAWYEALSTYLLENRFRRGTIDKTLFIKKDKGDIMLVQVYVDDIIFGSTKKSLCVEFEQMMHKKFQMSSMGELTFFLELQVMQKDDGIFISQDKYVADILKKFDFVTVKTASTPIETNKALLKVEEDVDVDTSHLHAVKRVFRYLKGQPKLGLWYPRDSPFDLEAFSDSDYAGASLDRKSTTGGCQFLGKRLISWQCKKQTIVANSTTEVEYVVAVNCYGHVLWIQNQMLDYGFNFMNTKIYINNESTICIVKNPVFHSKTKHIEIRHHFIRDSYEKKLIQFVDQQNMVACLERTEENAEFHQINTTNSQTVNDVKQVHATVNGKTVVIPESSVRSDLLFNDEDGITCLTNTAIFENLALMGYESDSDKLTFQKALFSPQWKYLIHTILHCLSSKSTSWNEFSTNIASVVICLATGQKFNFSKLIFDVVGGEGLGQPSEPQPPSSTTQPIIEEQIPITELSSPQNTQSPRQPLQKDSQLPQTSVPIPNVADDAVFKERDGRVVRATTTAASLDAAPASDPGAKKPWGDLTDFIPPTPHDSPLLGGHTPGSDEGRPNINELMAICTNLSNRILALEQSKIAQDLVINKLQKKVKRLEKALRARTLGMKLFKIGTSRRKGLDKENVSIQRRKSDKTKPMFKDSDFDVLDDAMENVKGGSTGEQIITAGDTLNTASINVSTIGPSNGSADGPSTSTTGDIFEDEMTTIVDTLVAIRSARPRTTSVVICNVEEEPRRATPVQIVQSQDKDKGKMVEPEPILKNPRKAQIQMDEELAQRLFEEEQAQFKREQRIARERAAEQEAKDAALIEQMEDVQARMDVDELLATRL